MVALCWTLNHQLGKKVTIGLAVFYVLEDDSDNPEEDDSDNPSLFESVDQFPVHWRIGIDSL